MVTGPPWTMPCAGPWPMDRVHAFSHWKIFPKPKNPSHICSGAPVFVHIHPIVHKISRSPPWKLKIISRYSHSHFLVITNRSLKFLFPYLCNRNSDYGDSRVKILIITSSLISCIHNTCLLHIDWLCACEWVISLWNRISKWDFKMFYTRTLIFSLVNNEARYVEHVVPIITFSILKIRIAW
jgi:hypothetical protein